MKSKTKLIPLYNFNIGVDYKFITNKNTIINKTHGYHYDTWDSGMEKVDFRVRKEWIGKKAKDCCGVWECFFEPIKNFEI